MRASLWLAIGVLAARGASAQTIVDDQPPPTVNVGAAVGVAGRYLGIDWPSTFLLSAQFPVTRFVVIEATATRWRWDRDRSIYFAVAHERWQTTSAGANLLLRAGRGRLAGSIGIGAGLQRSSLQGSDCVKDCETATFASSAVRTSPSLQFAGGADFRIAPRLVGFTSLLMIVGNEGALAVTGGVRVPLRTASFDAAQVRKADPVRDGIRRGALIGAAGGAFVGYGAGEPDSPGGEIGQAALFSAVGAGIGAGIGYVIDAVRTPRRRAAP